MKIFAVVSSILAFLGSSYFAPPAPIFEIVNSPIPQQEAVLGNATNPIAGTSYSLYGSGVSSAATSITLTSLTIPQTGYEILDADLSDTFYITLEPGSRTRQEIVSCTTVVQNANNTATLSGCSRGLLPFSPFTASSSYAFAHGGGTAVIFSDPPQLYNEFAAQGNTAYVTGVWKFASSSLPRASSTPTYGAGDELKFVTYGQLASTSFSGTVDGSETAKGIYEAATIAETAAGTSAGGTSALLIPQNKYFNATSSATTTIPVTKSTGKLDQGFLNLSEAFTFSATTTLASSTVLPSATSSVLITNSSGVVSGVAPGTSGNVLQSDGSSWTSASVSLPSSSGTSTVRTPANDVSTTTLNFALPSASSTSLYDIAFDLGWSFGTNATSTFSIASTTISTCSQSNTASFIGHMTVRMINSTAIEVIDFSSSVSSCSLTSRYNIDMSSAPVFRTTVQQQTGYETTSKVVYTFIR